MLPKLVALDAREKAGDGRENTDEPDESCESVDSDSSLSNFSMSRRWSCIRASTIPGRGSLVKTGVLASCGSEAVLRRALLTSLLATDPAMKEQVEVRVPSWEALLEEQVQQLWPCWSQLRNLSETILYSKKC